MAERGRVLVALLSVLLVVALAGAVVFLMSDINARRYRVVAKAGNVVVEKGRFLPFGYEPYVPETEELRRAYAPIELPDGVTLGPPEVFNDRMDVDRLLFSLLAGWSRQAISSEDRATVELASKYIARSELFPGLSEEQRVDLRTLRADLAYRNGRLMLEDSMRLLEEAKRAFELAMRLGTSRPTDAAAQIAAIRERLADRPAVSQPASESSAPPAAAEGTPVLPAPAPAPAKPEEPAGKWRL